MNRQSMWLMPIVLAVFSVFGLCAVFIWEDLGKLVCWFFLGWPLWLVMRYLFK